MLVALGVITGAHGIKGEVKLRSFTAKPDAIVSYPLRTKEGRAVTIVKLRPQKDGYIAVIEGVKDRDGAEALKGQELFVLRDQLPTLEEGEVYQHDLIGRKVALKDGAVLGTVEAIANYGAGDLLEVRAEARKDTLLIPLALATRFTADSVIVDLPEGFLEEEEQT